jgi:hypothetical protein
MHPPSDWRRGLISGETIPAQGSVYARSDLSAFVSAQHPGGREERVSREAYERAHEDEHRLGELREQEEEREREGADHNSKGVSDRSFSDEPGRADENADDRDRDASDEPGEPPVTPIAQEERRRDEGEKDGRREGSRRTSP